MNASELLAHKETLRIEFEKDMAAIDRIIGQLNRANGGGTEASTANGKATDAHGLGFGREEQNPRGPGRPGEMMSAIRDVIVHGSQEFSLAEIWSGLNARHHGHQFTRKAVSSALGRLANHGELRIHKPGVIGQHGNFYIATDKFQDAAR